jgi:hypothetical protein
MKRPFALWLLIFFLLFLAFGGLYGGLAMLLDPSGRALQMDGILPLLPVADYRLPGLFLLVVMGLGPIGLAYGLLTRQRWAWPGILALGGVLAVWLTVQGVLIGFQWPIQYVTAVNGLLIIGLALTPAVREFNQAIGQTTDIDGLWWFVRRLYQATFDRLG